ncbi:MAG: endonuclease MutS2 [Candidatus Kapabacteria bacterium]|nr:endonuclease MutS2 [Candidatus Kapabacteria bacterium]
MTKNNSSENNRFNNSETLDATHFADSDGDSRIRSNDLSVLENSLIIETLKELEFYSVLDIISKNTISDYGAEIIKRSFPSADYDALNRELQLVDEMKELIVMEESLPFGGFTDVRPFLHKATIQNSVLSATEMLTVRDLMRISRMIKSFINLRRDRFPNIFNEAISIFENRLLEKHIDEVLDDDGNIRDNASRELMRIRGDIYSKSAHLRSRLQKILRQVADEDMAQEEFVTMREERFVIPVKAEHKRHISGIIHGVSQTGSTVYVEPSEIIEMNNDLSLLYNEEKREIYKLLFNLTREIAENAVQFLISTEIVGHFDAVSAKARYAMEYGGIKPNVSELNEIYLNKVKHPILCKTKGIKHVLPLSVTFSEAKRGFLISGPNAGGKTVALKSMGLSILMALSGIFPLGECSTNYRTVFSSIGDRQSIENDLSTFSSQMLALKKILDVCDSHSLILIDELGSGTDPQEGAALAAGILDTFIELNLFFVVTTHQSSLKVYALNREEIENASLEFDEKNLRPTYKFLSGIPGNSYAFFLAQSIGMSELTLDRARKYLGNREKELENSISVLQRHRNDAEEIRSQLGAEREKLRKTKDNYESRLKDLSEKKRKYISDAKDEALNIIETANALVENTIREIREEKRQFAEIKHDFTAAKNKLETEVRQKKEKQPKRNYVHAPVVGEYVLHEDSSATGTILEIDEKEKTALVDFNGMKFRIPFDKLIKTEKKPTIKNDYSSYIKFDAKSRLDLRGFRADEAVKAVEDLINDAIVGNIPRLTIVHGKGTGALRVTIHDFLEKHPSIVSFRIGDLVEGGAGVTIIEL